MTTSPASALQVDGIFFDGLSSRRQQAVLRADDGIVMLSGDVDLQWPQTAVRVSQRLRHGVRRITFPDGSVFETEALPALDALLAATGFRDGWVIRSQLTARTVIAALLLTVLTLAAAYQFGIPAIARIAAAALPASVERAIGSDTLGLLDAHWFTPSTLPPARQAAIVQRFGQLTAGRADTPAYRILFRSTVLGPNAFALPSGDIILTDQLVMLAKSDDAVLGILGHELGHLTHHHAMRRVIQGTITAAVATYLMGDVSAVAVNLPTLMLDLAYSRDAEIEADDAATSLLRANGIALAPFAHVFELLDKRGRDTAPYLSSHPPSVERMARILRAP